VVKERKLPINLVALGESEFDAFDAYIRCCIGADYVCPM
jgi:hypothetical protein